MISVNNNLMAAKTANNLTGHYGRLQTSTERLSSGLRINSASDDAAGLAIRELMRSDIAALSQGVRNANDAISMIQTFDGALSIIDEKLIRMKELAEQAATGTYNSTQRLMIDSEFQAMGEEINRIARATDFNGIKLLDGVGVESAGATQGARANGGIATLSEVIDGDRKFEVSGGQGTFVNAQPNATATQNGTWDLSGITHPGELLNGMDEREITITVGNNAAIKFGDHYLLVTAVGMPSIPPDTDMKVSYNHGNPPVWDIEMNGQKAAINLSLPQICQFFDGTTTYSINVYDPQSAQFVPLTESIPETTWISPPNETTFSSSAGPVTARMNGNQLSMEIDLGDGNKISNSWTITTGTALAISEVSMTFKIRETTPKPVTPGPGGPGNPGTDPNTPGGNGVNGGANGAGGLPDLFTDKVKIHFGPGNDSAEDYYYINKRDATLRGLGLEGVSIQMQDEAQGALVKIDDAIEVKDKIRAEYGTMQNRLENTVSNLQIQAQNLQAAESRISDTEVAQEMMNFVRNQILTQSAVAMLAQANSVPQMVMSLIK